MVRRSTSKGNLGSAPVSVPHAAKAPAMKYQEASHLADKNSRTIMKLEQLVETIQMPGYAESDPDRVIERYCEKLKKRINRRLVRLARWSDSSVDERQSEFRRSYPSSNSALGGGTTYRPNPGYAGYPTAGSYPLTTSRISAPGIPNVQKTPMQLVGAPPNYTGQSGMRMAPPPAGLPNRNPWVAGLPSNGSTGVSTYQPLPAYQPRTYIPSGNPGAVAVNQVALPPLNPRTSLTRGVAQVQLQPPVAQNASNLPSQEQKNGTD